MSGDGGSATPARFDAATSGLLEAIYRTGDAARRRRAVLEALRPAPGEKAVDIGTGPGFLALELADAVGTGGAVLGIDLSEAMLELARRRCADRPQVRFERGDATRLPAGDASADVAVSVQVFEYVPIVADALREMHRVLRPGGRGVVVASDWTTVTWNSSDDERMKRVLAAFAPHCPHQDLPRRLAPLLRSAGFDVSTVDVLPQFNPVFDEDTFSMRLSAPIVGYVAGREPAMAAELSDWAADLRETGRRGDYFFCLNQYLFAVDRR